MEGVAGSPVVDQSVAVTLADILINSDEEADSAHGKLFKEELVEKLMRELYEEIMVARSGLKRTKIDESVDPILFEGKPVTDSLLDDVKDDEGLVREENGEEDNKETDGTE